MGKNQKIIELGQISGDARDGGGGRKQAGIGTRRKIFSGNPGTELFEDDRKLEERSEGPKKITVSDFPISASNAVTPMG